MCGTLKTKGGRTVVELIKKIGAFVLGGSSLPSISAAKTLLSNFSVKLAVKKCTVVTITPMRIMKWDSSLENVLVFKGMRSRIHDEVLAKYSEVCFTDSPDARQTRRNRAELLYMAERRGEELKRLLPDLVIRVFDLDGKPMSTAERAKICALAEGLNISI